MGFQGDYLIGNRGGSWTGRQASLTEFWQWGTLAATSYCPLLLLTSEDRLQLLSELLMAIQALMRCQTSSEDARLTDGARGPIKRRCPVGKSCRSAEVAGPESANHQDLLTPWRPGEVLGGKCTSSYFRWHCHGFVHLTRQCR